MADPFNSPSPQLADPVDHAFSISPHATNPIAFTTRAIYVGGAGNVVCRFAGDTADVTLSAVPAGTLLPIRVTHVRATSTATLLIGLY